ncbi:hypothetical protein BJV85_002070 [Clostridium acetobutylicum]|uniref:Uncharacterized protein n=1 Tax=Clostridium acetobutylicum (strain ATCC 824 / DSM 792 / JCM 1419 / IAM 19013 / LMG 5710 / NBRC 13948 / NRRL B-527 / VKM B-1787 / 2291 / W) TaxID=272562 RepID=Q97HT4_CLOAB|nr:MULTISPECIES: hypothetical protein [Clostridium]AAK79886.1 Hypothetical protein CA_C1923 [Clostridium acetobutylicum ATCC 824]ADZ20975.1 Conserved hypothetical protein [Clostridium acetobutylicum EA 2018]AEI32062.1 hypothetical protein SMB_G1951 [Clostridium acetobutylicum DSM 1731]AWV79683.1 hypothetical protein DK921_06130 [Clostridium acetobutylicum]MBC2394341.1 hypothetical protein [Clostridium acetobutylicum]
MAIETIEVTEAIWNTSKRLDKGVDYITQKAKEFASAEKEYRIALSKEIVKLKTEGMSVTLIPDVARGNVAGLKFSRDLAEQTYKASRDMLMALSNELSAMQSILKVQTKI